MHHSTFITHHSPRRGFTFIEIMIVLVVLGTLMAVALPKMKGSLQAARVKSAGRDVAGVLRIARDAAVMRELPAEVVFDTEKDTYKINLLDASYQPLQDEKRRTYRKKDENKFSLGEDAAGLRRLPSAVHFQAIYTAAPLSEDKDLPRVIFYSDGAASPATVVIQDDKEHAMTIELYRTTGMTHAEASLPAKEPDNQRRYYGPNSEKKTKRANTEVEE